MTSLTNRLLLIFFTALGLILGGSLIGSLATIFTAGQPYYTIRKLAEEMKIWAIVAAIGGTFNSFEALGTGLFSGDFRILLKHFLYIVSSLIGAEIGMQLIYMLTSGPK